MTVYSKGSTFTINMPNSALLNITNLKVNVSDKEILKDVNLEVYSGKTHALMGKNGSGKSTLAQILMGNPTYTVKLGKVLFEGKDVLDLEPEERAKAGMFLSFQYPSEVTGVNVGSFLRLIYNKSHEKPLSPIKFREYLKDKLELLNIKEDFLKRYLNDGFSGGEKKRMEMLQMLILEPKLAILDEVDSGLDVDAVKIVSRAVNYLKEKQGMTVLIITHYTRILKYIEPDYVHIMSDGNIVSTGTKELAHEIEEKGYDHIL